MEKILLYLLIEPLPGAITFSVIALLPLTILAGWKGARTRFIIAAIVCLNIGIWGGLYVFVDASWHGRLSGSNAAKLAGCAALIGLGYLAYRAAKRRHRGEITQLTTAPAIFSLLWLLFFGAFAGERWEWIYDGAKDARRAKPESWTAALHSALAGTRKRWNEQRPEARVDTLLFFGDPVHEPAQVVVWAVVPGPATDSLALMVHYASALVTNLHHWQFEKAFPCRSDFGIVSAGTLEAVGREQFFGEDGRRTAPQATYENHFNFYPTPDTHEQGPRCQFPQPPLGSS